MALTIAAAKKTAWRQMQRPMELAQSQVGKAIEISATALHWNGQALPV
jgi:hypothetical protein